MALAARPRLRRADQRGVAMVELALVVSLLATLLLGTVSAGLAYNQRLSLTHAAWEGVRYGSTLDRNQTFLAGGTWASSVRDLVVQRSNGDLTADQVCVALVGGPGSAPTPVSGLTATSVNTPGGAGYCFVDNNSDDQPRVQVSAIRPATIDAGAFRYSFDLRARLVGRHEQ